MGMAQARALGRTDLIAKEDFWRKYVSNLGRAERTANLILGEDKSLEDHGVSLEPLLRELAKGAREGYPKTMTYKEAEERYREEHGPTAEFPLLETEDEAYARVQQWMFQVVGDAIREHASQCSDKDSLSSTPPKVYSIFALSHSGTLRAVFGRLVPEQLPSSIDLTPVGRNGASAGAMKVPNTSVTIIDVTPHNVKDEIWDEERKSQAPPNPSLFWTAKLQTFRSTEHYQDVILSQSKKE